MKYAIIDKFGEWVYEINDFGVSCEAEALYQFQEENPDKLGWQYSAIELEKYLASLKIK